MNLTAVFIEAPEGGYTVFLEEFPGVTSQGETQEEARANLHVALEEVLEANKEFAEQMQAEGYRVIKEPFLWAAYETA